MALFQKLQQRDQIFKLVQQPTTNAQEGGMVRLIVGLGNIGKTYEKNRHNSGFMAVEAYRKANDFPEWQEKAKFKALLSEEFSGGTKIILVKPTTMYNLVGESVRALKDFYKLLNSDITVVHDELDLPFGTVKQKIGGGSGGNNGLKSLISHIGADFNRVRIGIKNDQLEKLDPADFVLTNFTAVEQKQLPDVIDQAIAKI